MPARILVADDDIMLQRLISNTLKLEHHEIIVADNGQQALEKARTEKPDLVILDVMMPGLNGFDVCTALRKDHATTTLPVIMLSGLGQVQEKIMGLKAGADEYLTKPIDPRELLTRVEMLLARHQVLRQSAAAKAGRVYSVIGAKGGVGVTTLAVNLAAYMSEPGKDVILLEFRPDFGTVSPRSSTSASRPFAGSRCASWSRSRSRSRSSPVCCKPPSFERRACLCGPQKAADFGPFTAAHGGALLSRLTALADFVIVDLPPASDAATEAIIKSSDQVIVVLEPEITCVAAAVQRVAQINGYSNTLETRLVGVNRQGAMLLSVREMESRLNRTLASMIPPATDVIGVAAQYGTPIVIMQPTHMYTEHIQEIAELVQRVKTSIQ
jgi:CheY-like chemotaxis protein/MinD-like ATPase involved in chromosome partitioning or flagellar assembly